MSTQKNFQLSNALVVYPVDSEAVTLPTGMNNRPNENLCKEKKKKGEERKKIIRVKQQREREEK